jgi:hypothetical protein
MLRVRGGSEPFSSAARCECSLHDHLDRTAPDPPQAIVARGKSLIVLSGKIPTVTRSKIVA